MNIRNLQIADNPSTENAGLIKQRIREAEQFIEKNFKGKEKESIHEYSLGSLLRPYDIALVIYNHPALDNNPYVFISLKIDKTYFILDDADIQFFKNFSDYNKFKDFKTQIHNQFNRVPNISMLETIQKEEAYRLARRYDEGHEL